METYNLGKIEILKDPRSRLKRIVPYFPEEKTNSGFTLVYGNNKEGIEPALSNLGFRLPSIKECIYLNSFFGEINEFEYKRFWVYTELGTEILLIDRYNNNYVWPNPPESLKYILFAVNGPIPS